MKKVLLILCIAVLMFPVLLSQVMAAEPVSNFTVDLSNPYRPVSQVASGSLYGLAKEGRPGDNLIMPTKPKMFTQMAPGGTHFPNGETEVVGDALVVAPIAERNGATVTIRMPDIFPDFPYRWISWDDWLTKVDQIVNDTIASGSTNIYGYELWNEPDWTWDYTNAGDFKEGWKRTYERVRLQDPSTKIIGPSITQWNYHWFKDFLTYARDHNVLPDIVSWHELGDPEGSHRDGPAIWTIESHIESYRALEVELGISPREISINEYGVQTEEGVPGNMVQYFAKFERSGVDTANAAFWYRPGRLSNIITDTGDPNGGWWLYKWYGDMSGQMAMTTPHTTTALGLDGIASIDSNAQAVHVLFGGSNGTANITVNGLAAVPFLGEKVHVKVEATPWYGVDTAVTSPIVMLDGDYDVRSGQIKVPVRGMKESWGYRMTIIPDDSIITQYEAEHATVHHANIFTHEHASNAYYVGQIDYDDSYLEYTVRVTAAGEYTLDIWYANGMGSNQTQSLSVNGGPASTIDFPATDGWIWEARAEKLSIPVHLIAGENTLRFAKGGYVEHDNIQITPNSSAYKQRWEAELASIHQASVFSSGYASAAKYVGQIDFADSYVEFVVNVPTTGTYSMEIGYGNGTSNTSTHQLSVNGHSIATVGYAPTGGWIFSVPNFGTRKTVTVNVNLSAGTNTIRFTKGSSYAELDYVELTR